MDDDEIPYEDFPEEVKTIIHKVYQDNIDLDGTYELCEMAINSLEEIGWTGDYDLGAELFDVRPITNEEKVSDCG